MKETRVSLLRSTPFRLALTFAFLSVLAFILSGAVVYQLMSADLARRLDQSIKETYTVVALTYAGNEKEDLVASVNNNADLSPDKDQLFSLSDADGNHLAGNFTASGLPTVSPCLPPDCRGCRPTRCIAPIRARSAATASRSPSRWPRPTSWRPSC
ncbi:hypothetical protein [Mesorhizobium sp.]|uniref:hypothetical protein n=1 Tax=Mesorhizobium sp. TaxID=1871066 RepID=UPI00345A2D8F